MNETFPQPQDRQLAALYRCLAPLLAAGVLFSGLILTLFTGHPVGGWLTVTAFLAASMLIGHPRRLILVLFILAAVHPTITNLYSHWILQMSDKLLALLLLAVVMVNFSKDRSDRSDLRLFNRCLFMFLGLAAVGTVINRVPPIQVLRFFLTYASFVPAFYMVYWFIRPNAADARRIVYCILALTALQLVLNLGWLVGVNPLPNPTILKVDFAIGTLGGCNIVAYLMASVIFLLFAMFHNFPDLKQKLLTAFGGLLTAFQLILTFTFHVLPLLALLVFAQTFYGVKALRYKLAMIAMIAVFTIGFLYVKSDPRLSRVFDLPAEDVMTVSEFRNRWQQMWSGSKGQAYYNIFVHARRDMPAWFIGAGPGNFASGIGSVHNSMLAEKYINYIYLTWSGRLEVAGGSITQHVTTGLSAIYSEFGPLGVLLFFGLHIMAAAHVLRLFRRKAYRTPIRRALAEAFIPTMLLYLGLNLISDFFHNTFLQVGIWMWAGAVWKPDAEEPEPDA